MWETTIPMNVGDAAVALLRIDRVRVGSQAGPPLNEIPTRPGAADGPGLAEPRCRAVRCMSPARYESAVRLLEIHADYLASCANRLLLERQGIEPVSIRRARRIIRENYRSPTTLGAVAEAVNLSPERFGELFKEAAGINFAEYVARWRVEKAGELLLHLDLRVSEIAFAVGFQSLSQFSRNFRKYVGMTPTEARGGGGIPRLAARGVTVKRETGPPLLDLQQLGASPVR